MLLFFSLSFAFEISPSVLISSLDLKDQATCKSFKYTENPSNLCLSESNSTFLISSCPKDLTCKFSIKYPKATYCSKPDLTPSPPSSQIVPESYHCNSTLDCVEGLFCKSFCTETSCEKYCSEKSMYQCQALDECSHSRVCNDSLCIGVFSIQPGEPADSRLACSSGKIENGICLGEVKSKSVDLPIRCETDDDCTASDGLTAGECICLGSESYCELHESDKLKLEFLLAGFESRLEDAKILYQRIYYFPYYELEKDWPEYLESSEENQNRVSGSLILKITTLILISSY